MNFPPENQIRSKKSKSFSSYRPRVESLEVRCLLATSQTPLLWMQDNDFDVPGGLPADYAMRFDDPEAWENVLRVIDTFAMRETSWRQVPREFIQTRMAPVLNANQVDVAIDTFAATGLQRTVQLTNQSAELVLNSHFDWLQTLIDDGLRLKTISLNGVLSNKLLQDPRWETYPLNERIADVVSYSRLLALRFPHLDVGIVDTLPSQQSDWRTSYQMLDEQVRLNQIELDHVHFALPVDWIAPSGANYTWTDVIDVQQYVQQDLRSEFGFVLTSVDGGNSSDDHWKQKSMLGLRAYQDALESSQLENRPDRIIITAWHPHPEVSVPSLTPAPSLPNFPLDQIKEISSLTSLTSRASTFLRGREPLSVDGIRRGRLHDEIRQVPPIRASASSTVARAGASAENAVFAKGVVDATTTRPDFFWQANDSDNQPWLKAELPQQLNVNRVRLWSLPGVLRPIPGATGVTIYKSRSGTGNPFTNPDQWQEIGTTTLYERNSQFVEVATGVHNTRFIALTFDRQGGAAGIAGMRIYSPNNIWLNPYISPLVPQVPDIKVHLRDVFEKRSGAAIATLTTNGEPAALNYRLESLDDRFEFVGSVLRLKPQVSLEHAAEPALAVWTTLTNVLGTFHKLVAFAVIADQYNVPTVHYDYGDAPNSYRAYRQDGGPAHLATGPILGSIRTSEPDGVPAPHANSDTGDDGVTFGEIRVGDSQASVTVEVRNVTDTGWLSGWIDFDGDGTFLGLDERIFAGQDFLANSEQTSGRSTLSFPVPPTARPSTTYARFRLSHTRYLGPDNYSYTPSFIPDGEVEDYQIEILPAISMPNFVAREQLVTSSRIKQFHLTDLDRDGDTDMVTLESSGIRGYQNNGQQRFAPSNLFNGDDYSEIHVLWSNYYNSYDILAAGPSGVDAFSDVGFGGNSTRSAISTQPTENLRFADLASQGRVDLLYTDTRNDQIFRSPSAGEGGYNGIELINNARSRNFQLADLSGDGAIDLVRIASANGAISYLRGHGNGTFDLATPLLSDQSHAFSNLTLVDLDGDGDLDILTNGTASCLTVCLAVVPPTELVWFVNDGGTFQKRLKVGPATDVFAVADVTGDSYPDVVYSRRSSSPGPIGPVSSYELVLRRNAGRADASELVLGSSSVPYESLQIADVDGNGTLDIAAAYTTYDAQQNAQGRINIYYQVDADHPVPSAPRPNMSYERREVTWGDPGATIAKVIADCCDAAGKYSLAVDDSRFTFFLTYLTLRNGVALGPRDAPELTVQLTLTDRDDPRRVFTYPFTFQVTAPVEGNGLAKDRFDYGDVPWHLDRVEPYSPARHLLGNLYLGRKIDAELGPQSEARARGDDRDIDGDDDDGVVFVGNVTTSPQATGTGTIRVIASDSGLLDGWIDFNGNGVFDHPAEHLFNGQSVGVGTRHQLLPFVVPVGATTKLTFARFRVSYDGGQRPYDSNPRGPDVVGEVEDYSLSITSAAPKQPPAPVITWLSYPLVSGVKGTTVAKVLADGYDANGPYLLSVDDPRFEFAGSFLRLRLDQLIWKQNEPTVMVRITLTDRNNSSRTYQQEILLTVQDELIEQFDYGDAPFRFGTTRLSDGPRHRITTLSLGRRIDAEDDGRPHFEALGDDLDGNSDDEDGVVLVTELISSPRAGVATVVIDASADAMLDAWFDFDGNGQFDHPREHLGQNRSGQSIRVTAGMNLIDFAVPADIASGWTYARVRISTAGGLTPHGLAEDGEVEDYRWEVRPSLTTQAVSFAWPSLMLLDQPPMDVRIAEDENQRSVNRGNQVLAIFDAEPVHITGGAGNDRVRMASASSLIDNSTVLSLGAGFDELVFESKIEIELSQLRPGSLAGVDRLNLRGVTGDHIVITPEVVSLAIEGFTPLEIVADVSDTITLRGDWDDLDLVKIDGQVAHQFRGLGSILHVQNDKYWTNLLNPADVNRDKTTTPLDALLIINILNGTNLAPTLFILPERNEDNLHEEFWDTNGDRIVTPLDALLVINELNRQSVVPPANTGQSEAEEGEKLSSMGLLPLKPPFSTSSKDLNIRLATRENYGNVPLPSPRQVTSTSLPETRISEILDERVPSESTSHDQWIDEVFTLLSEDMKMLD